MSNEVFMLSRDDIANIGLDVARKCARILLANGVNAFDTWSSGDLGVVAAHAVDHVVGSPRYRRVEQSMPDRLLTRWSAKVQELLNNLDDSMPDPLHMRTRKRLSDEVRVLSEAMMVVQGEMGLAQPQQNKPGLIVPGSMLR